jgi:cell division protein FtsI/penicillin-binding protein 2
MGTYPDFHPENYNDESKEVWRNHGLSMVYEPGSIMKSVTIAAALNEKLITPNTVMDAGNGLWMYAGKPLRDRVTGRQTIRTALVKSINSIHAQLG